LTEAMETPAFKQLLRSETTNSDTGASLNHNDQEEQGKQQAILSHVQETDFRILYYMGEKSQGSRSRTLLQQSWFERSGTDHPLINVDGYTTYAFTHGLPRNEPLSSNFAGIVKQKLLSFVGNAQNPGLSSKIKYTDMKYTTVRPGMVTNYIQSTLIEEDWNKDVKLIIASGHGSWYNRLVKWKGSSVGSGFANTKALATKLKQGGSMDYTEMVLLKWEKKQRTSHMRITEGYRPGIHLYNLPAANGDINPPPESLARYEAFGDDDAFYYDEVYDNYEEKGQFDDLDDADFGYYYGEDDGEYDNDDYEESLYEAAMVNLMRAKRQFKVAQRLLARERRMKAPHRSYH